MSGRCVLQHCTGLEKQSPTERGGSRYFLTMSKHEQIFSWNCFPYWHPQVGGSLTIYRRWPQIKPHIVPFHKFINSEVFQHVCNFTIIFYIHHELQWNLSSWTPTYWFLPFAQLVIWAVLLCSFRTWFSITTQEFSNYYRYDTLQKPYPHNLAVFQGWLIRTFGTTDYAWI